MLDVTVRGAGIFGLSIAWACLQRGARVRVVDPAGVGAGASGGIVGALAPHVPETWNAKKQFQLDSLLMAEAWWRAVEEAGGQVSGCGRTGRLQPVATPAALDLARERAAGAEALWQGQAVWQVVPVEGLGPWVPPSPTGYVVHDTLSARIHPRRACMALAEAIRVRGGEIVPEAPDRGSVVWATGWHDLARLSEAFGRLVGTGIKGQALLLDADVPPDAPQLFIDGLHVVPHADGTVAIGSTTEREFEDPTGTDAALNALHAQAVAALPMLAAASIKQRWAGLRPRTKSRAPLLGEHPLHPGQFIANGGFKIGFGMAPKVAEVMADLVLEGRDAIPESFRPEASLPRG